MKVLLINGSTRLNKCGYTVLKQMEGVFNQQGIETEILQMGASNVKDCMACNYCAKHNGTCVIKDDIVNEWLEKIKTADGYVFSSPVYYAHPSGQILNLLDRIFYAGGSFLKQKPGAVVVTARRGGTTASIDVLSKYLGINSMPIVTSSYWNMVHGNTPEEILQDKEGLQTIYNLALNMAWLLKVIQLGKQNGITPPTLLGGEFTNFIR